MIRPGRGRQRLTLGSRRGRQRLTLGSRLTGSAALATGVATFVRDLTANELGVLGQWVPWIMLAGALAAGAMWALAHREAPVPEIVERHSLTDRSLVVGRKEVIDDTARMARARGCVLVRGPRGIGTSAVAIEALRSLVTEPRQRHYVDAFDQDDREVRLSVLRTLDLPVAHPGDGAADLIVSRLRDSGEALLIDNVTDPGQVRWIARPISKAYVIVAGDLPPHRLHDMAEVAVGDLAISDALKLFSEPYGLAPPPTPRRWSRWRRRRPLNTIEKRVAAELGPAAELARDYLRRPRIVKETGRIFDANPNVSVSDLLDALRRDARSALSDQFRKPFLSLLVGVPKEGHRLLTLMALLPDAPYEVTALAALAGWPAERATPCLADLAARTLVHLDRDDVVRLAQQAGTLGLDGGRRRRTRARRRLYAYYAEVAADHADELGTERYPEARKWFANSAATLKKLALEAEPRGEVVQIADALEVWYAQKEQTSDREAVARALVRLETEPAASVGRLRQAAVARTRGDADTAARHLDEATPLRRTRGLAQWLTEAALQSLDRGDLAAARTNIEKCLAVRPPGDVRGRIGDEINLGVIAFREGADEHEAEPPGPEEHRPESLERAHYHFIQALDLAEDIGEISGQAQAHEMIGVVLARQQNTQAALREWKAAGELWARIGDEVGALRCDHRRDTGT